MNTRQIKTFIYLILINCITIYQATESFSISEYKLSGGDRIQISVFDEAELSLEVMLGDTGVINYPFLGEIKISGLTTNQAENVITYGSETKPLSDTELSQNCNDEDETRGLKPCYLINPSVQVSIIEYRPFFINGEVNNPGGYPYQPGLTVTKAVALAGGFSERASENSIKIIRATDQSQTQVEISLNAPIYPGDILTIDESFF